MTFPSTEEAARAIELTLAYVRERKAFGQSILDNQVVHFKLAELRTEVEALRALTYRAVEMYVAGQDVTKLASMAKLKAGRLSREVADGCLQYWGGMGFTADNPVSRAYRDGRPWMRSGLERIWRAVQAELPPPLGRHHWA